MLSFHRTLIITHPQCGVAWISVNRSTRLLAQPGPWTAHPHRVPPSIPGVPIPKQARGESHRVSVEAHPPPPAPPPPPKQKKKGKQKTKTENSPASILARGHRKATKEPLCKHRTEDVAVLEKNLVPVPPSTSGLGFRALGLGFRVRSAFP